jgi:hypothetical protein
VLYDEADRAYFDRSWEFVDIEIDGRVSQFTLSDSFWNRCPELRDKAITAWLKKQMVPYPWVKGSPPHFDLLWLGGNHRFRLTGQNSPARCG